jgi:hypothetical protein
VGLVGLPEAPAKVGLVGVGRCSFWLSAILHTLLGRSSGAFLAICLADFLVTKNCTGVEC